MYHFHPRFNHADFNRYFDASQEHAGDMSLEGGDVMMLTINETLHTLRRKNHRPL